MSADAGQRRFRVGAVEIDPGRGEVRREGRDVPLRAQSFQVLVYLIEHRDRLVGKDELHEQIWHGVSVGDDAITQCVADVRRALGDEVKAPRYIRTVPKRGYRFVAPVEVLDAPGPVVAAGAQVAAPVVPRGRMLTAVALATAMVLLALATGSSRPTAASLTEDLEAFRHYLEGLEHSEAFRTAEAIAAFERAIAKDPEFAMAHARIGHAYAVRHAQLDLAKPHLVKALALPERLSTRERLRVTAWLAIANQRYDEAIAASRALFERDDTDPEVAVQLITLLHGEGRIEEALGIAQRASATAPASGAVLNVLGLSHSLLGRHDDAVAAQQRQVALAPASANALDSLGLALQWAGRYEEALESYQRALDLDAGFEVAWFHRGNTLAQVGRYRDAREAFERAVAVAEHDADRARGLTLVGLVELARRDLAAAEGAFARARALTGRTPPEAALLADVGGDRTAAMAVARASVGRGANRGAGATRRFNSYLRARLAEFEGRPDELVVQLRAALSHPPPIFAFDTFEDALGQAYLRVGRVPEAIAEFERVLRLNPRYASARLGLAQARERASEPAAARQEYAAFLQIWRGADADAPALLEARRRLDALSERAGTRTGERSAGPVSGRRGSV